MDQKQQKIKNQTQCEINIEPSNDPRSYRQDSSKIINTGFKPKKTVNDAITEIISSYKNGFLKDLPEWHIMMEFDNMAQLDEAFTRVVPQQGELEKKHVSFNKYVEDDIQHALYRDWPDDVNKAKLTDQQPQVKIKPIDPELEKRMKGSWTVEEIVESMKRSYPEIWKK